MHFNNHFPFTVTSSGDKESIGVEKIVKSKQRTYLYEWQLQVLIFLATERIWVFAEFITDGTVKNSELRYFGINFIERSRR